MRIGIIGTGKIAELFVSAVNKTQDAICSAVFSRSIERAVKFADANNIESAFDDMEKFLSSDMFEAVYIATPNRCHAPQSIQAMKAHKHVICEKPIASNAIEAQQMYEAADENNVVLLEAMRPVFDPGFKKISELITCLGTIRRVCFSKCQYSSRYDNYKKGIIENAFNPELSNAAVMDIGVYTINPMISLFGAPKSVVADSIYLENGMEGEGSAILKYDNMIGDVMYSKITNQFPCCQIMGEAGIMSIDEIADTRHIELLYRDGRREVFDIEKYDNNMVYEVMEFENLISNHNINHKYRFNSIETMRVIDIIRMEQ